MATMRTCAHCGKTFLYDGQSIYKIPSSKIHKTLVYCSYTCYVAGKQENHYKTREPRSGKINQGY